MEGKKITYVNWWHEGARTEPKPAPAPLMPEIVPEPEPIQPAQPEPEPVQPEPVQPMQPTQGAPYIQPLVIVPYVSQDQPLYYYDPTRASRQEDLSEEYYENLFEPEESSALESYARRKAPRRDAREAYDYDAEERAEAVASKKRKFNVFGLLCFIFGGLYIAMLFNLTGLMESFTYNFLYADAAAFDLVKNFVTNVIENGFAFDVNTTLVPMLVAAGAVFTVITAIIGIATVASRTTIGIKVVAGLAFLLNAAALVVALAIVKVETTTYGLYILTALSFVMFLMELIARRKKI